MLLGKGSCTLQKSFFGDTQTQCLLFSNLKSILPIVIILTVHRFNGQALPNSCDSWQDGFTCSPEISQFWGQYSPYYDVLSELPVDVPDQCEVTFVQILSRHGARDPTAGKTAKYNATIQKIVANTTSFTTEYNFLKDFEYTLGADQLSIFGQQQMINSGHKFYQRYANITRHITPFIRSSGQDRVVESAQNWTQGFHAAREADSATVDEEYPYHIVVISEDAGQNNTLDHGLCTVFEESTVADDAQQVWIDIFTSPILTRLNENLRGADLDTTDVINIMDLCPFETVAAIDGKLSPFCHLFSEKEWQEYDYYQSLGKYYGYSWGNPLGASQGVGFANELIARLTATPVNDHTSTNHTMDDSEETFPLGGQTILYADFSHDNDLTGIFSALGLYNETLPLSNDTLQDAFQTNGYSASWTVPFAARAYFEKMGCTGDSEEYVRIVVNDRVLPLKGCGGDEFGRCTLRAFLDSLTFAKAGGDWDKCFV